MTDLVVEDENSILANLVKESRDTGN